MRGASLGARRHGGLGEFLLQLIDPSRLGDLPARGGVGHVERVDRRAFVRVDASERDVDIVPAKAGDQIVEQAEPVRRFHLDQGGGGMTLVLDNDACRKIDLGRAFRASATDVCQKR